MFGYKFGVKFRILGRLLIIIFLAIYLAYSVNQNSFEEKNFHGEKAYGHIEELTNKKYEGRFAGSEGNKLTLSYIESYFRELGIIPGGENGTYYQNFKDMLPEYKEEPVLNVLDKDGKIIKKYKVGEDFREKFEGFGGNGNAVGKIFPVDKSLSLYKAEDVKDKIILSRSSLRDADIEYAIQCGVRGIVISKSGDFFKSIPKMSNKAGKTILLSSVSSKAYYELLDYAAENKSISMGLNMAFNQKEIPNIIGKIEGKRKGSGFIIISAAIDGLGKEYSGAYFPGALKNASGTGTMLEIARTLSEQKNRCDETIVFIGWNNSYGMKSGIDYYAENPLYPLDKSQIIVLDSLGYKISKNIGAYSNTEEGQAVMNKISMVGEDSGIALDRIAKIPESYSDIYIKKDVPFVLIQDQVVLYTGDDNVGTYLDDINNIEINNLKRGGDLLLSYFDKEIYKDFKDIFTLSQFTFLLVFIFGILIIYFVELAYKMKKSGKVLGLSMEDIYYSTPINLLQKIYKFIAPVLIIIFLLAFIASIPQGFKIIFSENGAHANVSFFSVIRRSFNYINSLIVSGFGETINFHPVTSVMGYSVLRSLKLLVATLIFSYLVGTLSGIVNGARKKEKGGFKTLSTLVGISLPDVFIVIVIQIVLIFFYKHQIFQFLNGRSEATRFIMPFICLAIIPSGYVSRLVEVFVREEMKKEYIKSAKAKGLSKIRILWNHILKGASFKVMDSMQTILTMLISNLIIIEYLFPYQGVANNIFLFYRERDMNGFMGLVLALGIMYISFVALFKLIIRIINPLKRGNEQ